MVASDSLMNGFQYNCLKDRFLDMLTSMKTYRPQNLNICKEFGVEPKLGVKNTRFLRLDLLSNFDTRELNTHEVKYLFGHNFSGCGSYDLEI